jgi:hypothetical protein
MAAAMRMEAITGPASVAVARVVAGWLHGQAPLAGVAGPGERGKAQGLRRNDMPWRQPGEHAARQDPRRQPGSPDSRCYGE